MFAKLLSALGIAPKTVNEASGTLAAAKTFAESVNALFTAASLNLETMLSAGPDSLKLHIAGLDQSAEVTRLTAELATATTDLADRQTKLNARNETLAAASEVFAAIGINDFSKKTAAADVKSAFEAHVKKSATLDLAKTGHPPAHIPAAAEPAKVGQTGAELHAQWKAMKAGPDRLAFFSQHEAQITAFERGGS